ncbi:MAG: hypothetical protein EPO26_02740 [Chloroflexota bacterium]|nr:MAG: hypothetical protein EPO26_02740 [Chloroflexota bacterium]
MAVEGDPYEVTTRIRSASLHLGADSTSGLVTPGAPLRLAHLRMSRPDIEQHGRATFMAEKWATQPIAARARVIWLGWAQSFAASMRWEQNENGVISPRMRERLDELTSLLSGPATRGELRVLDAYEAYFQSLFTLGWAVVVRADPTSDHRRLAGGGSKDADGGADAWAQLTGAWIAPWHGRRGHEELFEMLRRWVDPARGELNSPRAS